MEFFPHSIPLPQVKLKYYLKQAASDIMSMLAKPPFTNVPTLAAGYENRNAIPKLTSMLKRAHKIPYHQDTCDEPLPRVLKPILIKPTKATSKNHQETAPTCSIIPCNDD